MMPDDPSPPPSDCTAADGGRAALEDLLMRCEAALTELNRPDGEVRMACVILATAITKHTEREPLMGYERELGKIERVEARMDRDFFYTVWSFIDLDSGGTQGFGGYMLGKNQDGERKEGERLQKVWLRELCSVFGVDEHAELEGLACYALRDFDQHSEVIRGLEDGASGRRFLVTDFSRRHFPNVELTDPLERRKADLRASIARRRSDIARDEQRLATVADKYHDWAAK
jgi:hypothetical protein